MPSGPRACPTCGPYPSATRPRQSPAPTPSGSAEENDHVGNPLGVVFIAVENLIDDQRRVNAFGLLVSLCMLLEVGDGFDFTGADFRSWCSEAGFRRFAVLPLGGSASAAIAYK